MSKGIAVTDSMKQRSVLNSGDKTRLYSVINRAARGETITFSVIGGSITHGCHADSRRESYAELAAGWWKDRFPWTVVNYINAGIGATDSYIGVHRVSRDLLSHNPDVVIVEFSVNDTDTEINPESYRSLVSRILSHEPAPAVILLFTMERDGTNFQKCHIETGKLYDVPVISYADAVFPEIQSGNLRWEDISPDDIHPSGEGHAVIAELINSYMETVFSEAFSAGNDTVKTQLPEGKYASAEMYDNRNIVPAVISGFKKASVSNQFPHGWTSEKNGLISFTVTARNIGILYLRTKEKPSGIYNVKTDGVLCAELDGDFSEGWGDYTAYKEVYTSDTEMQHTIEISMSEKSATGLFTITGICIS